MDQFKIFPLVFVLLSASILVEGHLHPPIKSFQKEVTADRYHYFTYALSKNSIGFNYVACNSTSNVSYCKTTKEIPMTDEVVIKKTCKFHISKEDPAYGMYPVPLNDETILLIKYTSIDDHLTMKIYVTRLTDCWIVQELAFPNFTQYGNVYANKHVFDVFYTNEQQNGFKVDCQNYLCRETYSLDGRKIRGPEQILRRPNLGSDLMKEVWVPLLVDPSPRSVSFQYVFYANNSGISHRLYQVSEGVRTELFNNSITFLKDLITVDNANEKLSFCQTDKDSVACRQYDLKAKLKLSVDFNMSDYTSIPPENIFLQPYNLRQGGLIVVIVETALNESRRFLKIENLKILGISESGRYSWPLEISFEKKNLTCSRDFHSYSFMISSVKLVEDGPEICLQILCLESTLGYSVVCLPKSHLDKLLNIN